MEDYVIFSLKGENRAYLHSVKSYDNTTFLLDCSWCLRRSDALRMPISQAYFFYFFCKKIGIDLSYEVYKPQLLDHFTFQKQ